MTRQATSAACALILATLCLSTARFARAQGVDPTTTAQAEKAAGPSSMAEKSMGPMVEGASGKGMAAMSGTTAVVPKLKEKRVVTVKGNENWEIRTGFGRNGEMAGMMMQMMTEGVPGMEHMKMGAMNMDYGPANFTETADELNSSASEKRAMPGMNMASTALETKAVAVSGQTAAASLLTVTVTPNPPVRGDNALDILVTDSAVGKPVTGLKLSASVEMTSMDMGAAKPAVKEVGNGHYTTTAIFNMNGPWRVTLTRDGKSFATLTFHPGAKRQWTQEGVAQKPASALSASDSVVSSTLITPPTLSSTNAASTRSAINGIKITAKFGSGTAASVGDNKVLLTILDAAGKPVIGANVTASVEMTSMDMGLTKPEVKEVGNGIYATTANFGMSGPWKITVRITPLGAPAEVRTVPVTVKRN